MTSNEKRLKTETFFTITNYFFWFLMGNFYFALCNIPLLVLLFLSRYIDFFKPSLVEIFLCCLPFGPSFTALLAVMGKIIREKDVNITKEYFRMYKMNFKQALCLWFLQLLILLILYVDIQSVSYPVSIIFILLFAIVLMTGLYLYPIISRFYLPSKDAVIISFLYLIKHFKVTICIIFSLIFNYIIFYFIPSISILFIASALCYFVMYYQKDILKSLEDNIR